jgi:ATP-dependent RNA helicase DeaD
MADPEHINVAPERITVENIRQTYISVDEDKKFELLLKVLEREKPRQCIIFCERKLWSYELYKQLRHHHKRAAVMHGDLDQKHRELIMKRFRDGSITCLVATDVVGRGIDVMGISHIINYDLPEDPENYVHRIGRTGRMGKDGIAIAFVTREQGDALTRIEHFINLMIPEDRIDGFEACRPRPTEPEEPKVYVPVFGRRQRRYSRRL